MAFKPTVIEKGLNAGFAKKMAQLQKSANVAKGIMAAVMEVKSTGSHEKLGWIGAMPVVKQWLGELDAKEFDSYDYTVKNLDWASSVMINENDVEDDQVGVIRNSPEMLADRIMAHPPKLMIDLLTNGDSDSAYDGVAFYSNVSGVRTIDNLLGGTGTTLSQLEVDLNAALVAMAKFVDDQGEVLDIAGTQIVCPKALERRFKRLVMSMTDPTASVEGTFNPYTDLEVVSSARLDADDSDDWYLNATLMPVKPLIYQKRQAAKNRFAQKGTSKNWIWSADYRGNGAYGLPHLSVKTVN